MLYLCYVALFVTKSKSFLLYAAISRFTAVLFSRFLLLFFTACADHPSFVFNDDMKLLRNSEAFAVTIVGLLAVEPLLPFANFIVTSINQAYRNVRWVRFVHVKVNSDLYN